MGEEIGDDRAPVQNTRPACMRKCSTTGPRQSTGKWLSAPTMTMTPMSSVMKSQPVVGKVPGEGGATFFRDQAAGDGEHRDDHDEAADQHRDREPEVVEIARDGEPAEGAAVVVRRGGPRVEDFAESVRALVVEPGEPGLGHHRDRRANQQHGRRRQHGDGGPDDFRLLDFLAEIFRRSPDHQAGDERP